MMSGPWPSLRPWPWPWPVLVCSVVVAVLGGLSRAVLAEQLLVGYLTGSDRRPHDHRYPRPGLAISGAIALARDEVSPSSTSQADCSKIAVKFEEII